MTCSFPRIALTTLLLLVGGIAHAFPVTLSDAATSGGAWSGNTFTPNAANAVAMVGTRASCQPMPVLTMFAPPVATALPRVTISSQALLVCSG